MKRYEKKFKEEIDLNELIGEFKSKYAKLSQVKSDNKFKKLSQSDKVYVIDELKADFIN